jgi:hypothetical protein
MEFLGQALPRVDATLAHPHFSICRKPKVQEAWSGLRGCFKSHGRKDREWKRDVNPLIFFRNMSIIIGYGL